MSITYEILPKKTSIETVSYRSLKVPRWQRRQLTKHVDTIAREFEEDYFGLPTVARTKDGIMLLVDGLQRCSAAARSFSRKINIEEKDVDIRFNAVVVEVEDEIQAVRLFAYHNTHRKLSPKKHREAKRLYGDDLTIQVDNLAEEFGYGSRGIAARNRIELLIRDNKYGLAWTILRFISTAFPKNPKATGQYFIDAVRYLVNNLGERGATLEDIAQFLANTPGAFDKVSGTGLKAGGVVDIVQRAEAIVEIYNRGKRTNRATLNNR